jgi:hypothetical protein
MDNNHGGWIMVTKLSIAVAIVIGMCIGSGVARPDLRTFVASPSASEMRVDFDQVFSDVTRQGDGYVERARKSDRLPKFKAVSPESGLLPYCEPVASPFVDPILSRVVGRCAA